MALTTSAGSGGITSQANTQSPQTSVGSGLPPTTAAKSVQPGTASSLLAGPEGGSSGIPLSSTILPVASLDASTHTAAQTQQPAAKASQHHPNAALLAIVIVLLAMAILAFWLAKRSEKNTTNY